MRDYALFLSSWFRMMPWQFICLEMNPSISETLYSISLTDKNMDEWKKRWIVILGEFFIDVKWIGFQESLYKIDEFKNKLIKKGKIILLIR